ncbi:MAG: cytochrome B6 [Cycloclasticus sp. symbiont of Bathymodiolus heckerae]|nr:MAG: cytochrome B6 [Cycloclasticus sp. symbiont of Bathymodiolus heckerae]
MVLLVCLQAGSLAHAGSLYNEPISPIPDPINDKPAITELGNKLFHDARFSSDKTIACASCHSLVSGGMDGKPVSIGVESRQGNINAPTVFNSSLNFKQFWDGRAANLMEQIDGPIHSKHEMNSSWPAIVSIIQGDPSYQAMFTRSYSDGVTVNNIKHAIVTFESSLLTPNSRFDQYLKGDKTALSKDEVAGYELFKVYGCVSCHQGVNIGGNLFQKLGIVHEYVFTQLGSNNRDLGRFNITKKEEDKYFFKVPSLRNIALTAPYLHDGSEQTLEGVVAKMMYYQLGVPSTKEDRTLIVKYLKTLTGEYNGKLLK